MEYILEMKEISKAFPGVKALDHVNLKVRQSEVHALMGENGAGKSTLMKVLFGQYQPDAGEIFLNGQRTQMHSIKDAVDHGIAMVYQELSPIGDLSIAENVFVGRYPKSRSHIIDWKQMYGECQKIFDRWGLKYDPRMQMKLLKTADVQMIEIIKAISFNAKIVIMDEPTSSISQNEVERLFDFIRTLKKSGITIIMISHKLEEVFEISDTITVLRDGKFIGMKESAALDRATLINMMVGREMSAVFPKKKHAGYSNEILFEAKNISNGPKVRNVSFKLHKGEILGFAGIVGAGRTETMRAIFGLDKKQGGQIFLNGKEIKINCVRDAIKNDILMATESRKDDGLILCRSVEENILLPSTYRRSKAGILNVSNEKELAENAAVKLKVKMSSIRSLANFLSGGNQQKVILAKWLMMNPKVLILDEPTRGIDVGAKWEIYNLIINLAEQGVGIIFVSSEMEEVINLSDRVTVMCDGQVNGILDRNEVSQTRLMDLASEVTNK